MNRRMNKWYVAALVFWLVLTVMAVVTMPNLDALVREKGQVELPSSVPSEMARAILNEMDDNGENHSVIAVFYSGGGQALSAEQRIEVETVIRRLQEEKQELGITKIVSHLDGEETERQLVSSDGTTILVQMEVDADSGTVAEVSERLYEAIQVGGVQTYLTGADLIVEDFVRSSQQGVKKTELFSVIVIILILILVYRSPIVPVVSLLTVGVAYLVSLNVVAHLVDWIDFPLSNFTQVFLVVVLFGIGTDYNILLYSRFKEELGRQKSVLAAVKATFRTAGKTVLYSGMAVFIGFAVLFLADFKIYRSGAAVAVGVGVLLAVLVTLNPFFMALLGRTLFWPMKRIDGHGDSRLWRWLSRQSVARPFVALLIVGLVCIPLALRYSNELSFNNLWEVDDAFLSKQGIAVIESHFPSGFSSPATLVIRSDKPLDRQEALQRLDELAEKVANIDGVAEVYGPTRPAGEKISQLYLRDQTDTLNRGLREAASGLEEMNEGFSEAEKNMAARSDGLDEVSRLVEGTGVLKKHVEALDAAVRSLEEGISRGAAGAGELSAGLDRMEEQVGSLAMTVSQMRSGYRELETGFRAFGEQLTHFQQAMAGPRVALQETERALASLIRTRPELAEEQHVRAAMARAQVGQQQLTKLDGQFRQALHQYDTAVTAFHEANASLARIEDSLSMLKAGVAQLNDGAARLGTGLEAVASGTEQLASRMPQLTSGMKRIYQGQRQLLLGLEDLEQNMNRLRSDLAESAEGLTQISEGLKGAQDYLTELHQSSAADRLFIPADVWHDEQFQAALDMYISKDRRTAKMTIILDVNPYTKEAMAVIDKIEAMAQATLKGTDLEHAELAIGGTSAQNNDLEQMSRQDFIRTMFFMLTGIGVMLMVITRSLGQSVIIIAALSLAYGAALGLTELLVRQLFGVELLGWNVPFFSFMMLVALGVDYSIFLMMRYREVAGDAMRAIVEACTRTGSVVMSAAIILGATFAALYPSGVLSLMEIATVVIIGLALLSLLMMPVFLPAMTKAVSQLNMWGYQMKFKMWKDGTVRESAE